MTFMYKTHRVKLKCLGLEGKEALVTVLILATIVTLNVVNAKNVQFDNRDKIYNRCIQ